jgi:hypothetical protein
MATQKRPLFLHMNKFLIYFFRMVKAKRSCSIISHPGLIMAYQNIPQNFLHSVIVSELCTQWALSLSWFIAGNLRISWTRTQERKAMTYINFSCLVLVWAAQGHSLHWISHSSVLTNWMNKLSISRRPSRNCAIRESTWFRLWYVVDEERSMDVVNAVSLQKVIVHYYQKWLSPPPHQSPRLSW